MTLSIFKRSKIQKIKNMVKHYAWRITLYVNKHICRTCAPCAISGAPRKKYYYYLVFFLEICEFLFIVNLLYTSFTPSLVLYNIIYWPPHTCHTRKHTHLHTQGLSPRNTAVRHPNGIILSLRIHIMYTTGI